MGGNLWNHSSPSSSAPLPLNLLALIISYLDEPGDLARACRTCRVLHYMTLPQLYSSVSLHSYDHIRISPRDGKPEGWGGSSPFIMALNALVTRNTAGYIRKFRVYGEWKVHDMEECARVGRVPDESGMLTTLVRAAIDRMPLLESFSWELNTKMLPTMWEGLVQRPNLHSLTVKFPGSRLPTPIIHLPPFPKLQWLKITDIDPLCYPDDISRLLLGSKKLQHLKLHWSPRMQKAREPSTSLQAYFGTSAAAGYRLTLKSLALQNLYAAHDVIAHEIIADTMEEFTMINGIPGVGDAADLVFWDYSWRAHPPKVLPAFKMFRCDKISRTQMDVISKTRAGLEKLYLITGRQSKETLESDGSSSSTVTSCMASPEGAFTPTTPKTPADSAIANLCPDYLEVIYRVSGSTLRHLLLLPHWRLTSEDLARLVQACPNLEQLGLGLETPSFNMLQLLMPFLPKLFALRVLDKADDWALTDKMLECSTESHEKIIGYEAYQRRWKRLGWIGIGDLVFEVNNKQVITEIDENGVVSHRKKTKRRPAEAVRGIDIWEMDRLDVL